MCVRPADTKGSFADEGVVGIGAPQLWSRSQWAPKKQASDSLGSATGTAPATGRPRRSTTAWDSEHPREPYVERHRRLCRRTNVYRRLKPPSLGGADQDHRRCSRCSFLIERLSAQRPKISAGHDSLHPCGEWPSQSCKSAGWTGEGRDRKRRTPSGARWRRNDSSPDSGCPGSDP